MVTIRVAVVKRVRRGRSFISNSALQKWPPSHKERMKKTVSNLCAQWVNPCPLGVSQCSLIISVASSLSSFTQTFSYYCFLETLAELLTGSLKLMRYHQPFQFLSRDQRRLGVEFRHVFGRCLFWLSGGCLPAWRSHRCHWCEMV